MFLREVIAWALPRGRKSHALQGARGDGFGRYARREDDAKKEGEIGVRRRERQEKRKKGE